MKTDVDIARKDNPNLQEASSLDASVDWTLQSWGLRVARNYIVHPLNTIGAMSTVAYSSLDLWVTHTNVLTLDPPGTGAIHTGHFTVYGNPDKVDRAMTILRNMYRQKGYSLADDQAVTRNEMGIETRTNLFSEDDSD